MNLFLAKNHSMIIDEDWYEPYDHLTILWIQWDYEHLFGPDVRRSSEKLSRMFLFLMFSRKHCLMSIKGCLRRQFDEAILKIKNIEGGSLEQRN